MKKQFLQKMKLVLIDWRLSRMMKNELIKEKRANRKKEKTPVPVSGMSEADLFL